MRRIFGVCKLQWRATSAREAHQGPAAKGADLAFRPSCRGQTLVLAELQGADLAFAELQGRESCGGVAAGRVSGRCETGVRGPCRCAAAGRGFLRQRNCRVRASVRRTCRVRNSDTRGCRERISEEPGYGQLRSTTRISVSPICAAHPGNQSMRRSGRCFGRSSTCFRRTLARDWQSEAGAADHAGCKIRRAAGVCARWPSPRR